jgi:hypothetical protein
MKAAGSVPGQGFCHEENGVHFEVLRTDATHIEAVAVSLAQPRSEAPERIEEPEQAVGS